MAVGILAVAVALAGGSQEFVAEAIDFGVTGAISAGARILVRLLSRVSTPATTRCNLGRLFTVVTDQAYLEATGAGAMIDDDELSVARVTQVELSSRATNSFDGG